MNGQIKEKRNDIVIIRVICMCMIILCHVIQYYTFIPLNQMWGQILNVGVEIFLIISGFLYGKKTITEIRKWIIKRLKRILVPVVMIVVVDLIILCVVLEVKYSIITACIYMLNLQGVLFINWSFFSKYINEITNLGPLWFMTIIMICYALVPLLQRGKAWIAGKRFKVQLCFISLVLFYILAFLLESFTGTRITYFGAFLIGFAVANIESNPDKCNYSVMLTMGALALLMQIFRLLLRQTMDGSVLYASFTPISHIFLALWLFIMAIELNKRFPIIYDKLSNNIVFQWFDEMSFYIYLTHGLFCLGEFNVYKYWNSLIATVIFIFMTLLSASVMRFVVNRILLDN